MTMLSKLKCLERCRRNTFMLRVRSRSGPGLSDVGVVKKWVQHWVQPTRSLEANFGLNGAESYYRKQIHAMTFRNHMKCSTFETCRDHPRFTIVR